LNRQSRANTNCDEIITTIWFMKREIGNIIGDMVVSTTVGIPLVICKKGMSLGYHYCKLGRMMTPLKIVVYLVEAIKSPVTKFATNLTRTAWSTTELGGRSRLVLSHSSVAGQQNSGLLLMWTWGKMGLRGGTIMWAWSELKFGLPWSMRWRLASHHSKRKVQ
jgi:hypothetical protein